MTRPLLLAAAVAALLSLPATTSAVVPPKACGSMTLKGKRYQVKAKKIKCSTARDHVRRYFTSGRKPGGYRCQTNPPSESAMALYCNDGTKVVYAIRR